MENKIELEIKRCKRVISRIEKLPVSTSINQSCTRTLLKLAHSELSYLSRSSLLHSHSDLALCVNIGHLEAVVHLLEQSFITGVSRVCKRISLIESCTKTIHVDIVCTVNKNPVWIVVSDRNPKYISWNESFKLRIEQLLSEARSSRITKACSILLFFARGVDGFVLEKLTSEFGAFEVGLEFHFGEELDGEWVNVTQTPYQDSVFIEIKVDCTASNSIRGDIISVLDCVHSDGSVEVQEEDNKVVWDDSFSSILLGLKLWSAQVEGGCDFINFDTTTLIAIVSGISNGSAQKLLATPKTELKQRFKGNTDFVVTQALSEVQNPIHEKLADVINGKRCIICESVLSEFKEIVSLCGGPNEKLRADNLLKQVVVVPDSPSERMMCLPTTRKLAMKNKVAFGTGDHWRAPTLTANIAFVRAVSQTGMSLFTIEHQPRALTGD